MRFYFIGSFFLIFIPIGNFIFVEMTLIQLTVAWFMLIALSLSFFIYIEVVENELRSGIRFISKKRNSIPLKSCEIVTMNFVIFKAYMLHYPHKKSGKNVVLPLGMLYSGRTSLRKHLIENYSDVMIKYDPNKGKRAG